ncbi:hypothetical protein NMH_2040 [Neisseria meningitidis H44/76]|uniref:Uncharacterized protein n=2 Tax=Neisseria meningitidis serogroup B TaxID=491 RepID=A0A0H5QG39_NEIMI|nr:hypothetical protein NMH_2040 [Neisseria meningitidis H44/76]CRZ00230.1 FIG00850792: hypothetical protein [Neisseria meningitidis serogroup B]
MRKIVAKLPEFATANRRRSAVPILRPEGKSGKKRRRQETGNRKQAKQNPSALNRGV